MRNGGATEECGGWWRSLGLATLALLAQAAGASTAPPHEYYVLGPEPLSGPLSVMSLEPNNTITFGSFQLTLQQYQTASIPASAFTSGTKFSGTGFFILGSSQNATDLLVPDDFAGTAFVIPHVAGSHKYFLLSPSGTAQVTIRIGASTVNLSAAQGVVNEFDAGGDNSVAGRITSDVPIVVTHVAYLSGTARDAYPVAPAAGDLIGIRSQNTLIGALSDGTSVTVFGSNGSSNSYSLDAGQQVAVTTGTGANQGQGSALHVVASAPVGVVQYDDGDGSDATAFWTGAQATRRQGLPVDAQYLAIACDQPSVTLTLYKGADPPETQSCSGSGTTPGKAYFGLSSSGANLRSGWYLIASSAVYAMYEASSAEDEHNLLGLTPIAGPTPPTLDSIVSPTSNNPQAVMGTAGANQLVRLYVNGLLQATTTANGSGNYSFNAALIDGTNTLYATAVTSGNESDPSNAVSVDYSNTIPRSQSGTLSGTVVWTPGSPAQPYIITASLTIASGAKLILQPGTTLKFANGTTLTATGELKIAGTAASPVTLTSNAATPTRGSWSGVLINGNAGSTIEYATIEYTLTAVNVAAVPATVRNSTIRYFTNNGVYVNGAGAAGTLVSGNFIDNLNDTGDCIEANNSSPQIVGNTLTNCSRGIFVFGTAAPTVNGNNIITGNDYGISVSGNNGVGALPVVNGNQLFANDTFNYHVITFGSGGSSLKLNATGNWWGTTIDISADISDLSDANTGNLPSVDYGYYLDGPTGNQVQGNYLIGRLTTSTVLNAGVTYDVLGVLFANSGTSLTVQAGATLRFHAATPLIIDGTLSLQGTAMNPVIFTSAKPTPARNDWSGIVIRAAGSIIENAVIEYAVTAVNVTGVVSTVRNNTIRYFQNNGVYVSGAAAAATVVQSNIVDNFNDTGDCIEANASGPTISGNTLRNCQKGVNVTGVGNSTTVNGNNIITENDYGLFVDGANSASPAPVVTGNQLFGNDLYNYYTEQYGSGGSNIKLNATGNWWGSTTPSDISTSIRDLTDAYTTQIPTVDYSSFLDGPNGTPVAANYLIGRITSTSSLTSGTTYDVLGVMFVNAGATLTIPAGATLRFHTNTLLVVDGALVVQGAASNPATFTSATPVPARDDWVGILVRANGSLIEYARIEYTSTGVNVSGVAATVRNNTIRYFQANGVYVSGAGAAGTLVQGNMIDNLNDTGDCIEASSSSPTISGNTLTNCLKAVNVTGSGNTTTVNGNNIITGNDYGLFVDGANSTAPAPTVTGNQLFNNDLYNYYTEQFMAGTHANRNATGNWWGSMDIPTISSKIFDASDNTASTLPSIDYANFLDGPTGAPVLANYLIGRVTANTPLSAIQYNVLGVVFVNSGVTLTIPAGATLRFYINSPLIADGTLAVQGASGNLVTFTSAAAAPAAGNWTGIVVRASGSSIEYAKIEYATTAVNLTGASGTVRNNLIGRFVNNGIYLSGTAAAASIVQDNTVDNLNDTGDCIEANALSAAITGNTLTNCLKGVNITGGGNATAVNANVIIDNDYGMFVDGANSTSPAPVATGNQLYANDLYDYYTEQYPSGGANIRLNATGNWWGSIAPAAISSKIFDQNDSSALPIVDYSGFLDAANGAPVAGNQLIGRVLATTSLVAGQTYDVLGMLTVAAGVTLTVPEGTVLKFHSPATRLIVEGTLNVQGTTEAKVLFTSALSDPAKGSWYGIDIRASATSVAIDHAIIEWAQRAVSVTGTNATIGHSLIRNFSDTGIWMSGASSASQISGNYIDNYDSTGYGIYLSASSPAITGNQIYRTSVGIYLIGASSPAISANAITNNGRGIVLDGNNSNSVTAVPNPVITGNDIFGNVTSQLDVYRYGSTNPVVINATGNWWGTAAPQNGQQIRYTNGSPTSALNYSSPATAQVGGPVGGNVVLTEYYFSPNSDSVKDSTTVTGTLSQSAAWTVTVRNPAYSAVRSFSGSGTSVSAVWDGRNSSGQVQPDGVYAIEVAATGASGTSIVGARLATLDNTAPTTLIGSPASGAIVTNVITVPVSGSASDPYLVNFGLEYGAGSPPTTWIAVNQSSTAVAHGLLGTWVVSSIDGGSALASGAYALRLTTSDKAGNVGQVQIPVTLDLLSISNVSPSVRLMKPTLGEQLQVNFTLGGPATVALRIYSEAGGALVKEITQVFATGGAQSLTWDGRTAGGAYVADEAYSFALHATDGTRTANYDPPLTGDPTGSGTGSVDTSFNANKNDFWKMNYTMNHYGRIRMQVSGCTTPTHFPYNWVPYPPGVHPLKWDGRGSDGQLVSGSCSIYFDAPLYMKANSVIVRGTTPMIMGTGASPNVEVKSNPYRVFHSYEQFSRITYRLDQDSYVTVKLLPPGVSDPASPQAIVITNNELRAAQGGGQPVDHVFEWKGYEDTDTNNILVSAEGSYTFTIQATSVVSGATSLYRGVLQLWQ